jgi:hypothetical protein
MADLSVRIPTVLSNALVTIENLEDNDFNLIIEELRDFSPVANPSDIAESISEKHPSVNQRDVASIIAFGISTKRLQFNLSRIPDSFAESQTVAAAVSSAFAQNQGKETSARLTSRVAELLDLEFVTLREKSNRLSSEANTVLKGATTFTDLRPVFHPRDDVRALAGFVILTTIKFEIETDDEPQTLYIQTNHDGLIALKAAIARAEGKTDTLEDLIDGLNLLNLTVDGGEDE